MLHTVILCRGLKTKKKKSICDVCVDENCVVQGDAGQKGAGQTGPEGSGGDSGELTQVAAGPDVLYIALVQSNKLQIEMQLSE